MAKKNKAALKAPKVYVEDYEAKISIIIENFRFNRVQLAMQALHWKWASTPEDWIKSKEESLVEPSIERMQATARQLLRHISTSNNVVAATGGFHATRYDDGCLELFFVVESYQSADA
jgi:hypothetical protein